jgi:hypothetical protein
MTTLVGTKLSSYLLIVLAHCYRRFNALHFLPIGILNPLRINYQMTDTYSRVENSLLILLRDPGQKVIALKGKWGTGKTYLWRAVSTKMFGNKPASEQPIYVSLFGVKTINDLKLRILQNAYLKDASTTQKLMKTGGGFAKQFLQKYTGYSAEDAALLWLPELVAGRLIVVDDIERKHKSLDIDEFLGVLDEYTETHKTRFLILLNTDKLNDIDIWNMLHEKVIAVEVVLEPTPAESFDVAALGMSASYLSNVRAAVAALKINNIRVIKRILTTIQRIAEISSGSKNFSVLRWVPSTVLLTASHYKAIDGAPPFEYVKSFNSFSRIFEMEKEDRDSKEVEWDALLEKLGINGADDYEVILQEYLRAGMLDVDRLTKIFEQYEKEFIHAVATKQRKDFFEAVRWDPHQSKDELLKMARALSPTVDVLDPGAITDLVSVVEVLGDSSLAREFLDAWLISIDTRPEYQDIEERIFEDSFRKFHPEVIGKMNAMRDKQHPPLTVIEAAERIVKNSGWGERERIALRNSTAKDYEDALRNIKGETLRCFLSEHIAWVRNGPYDENFRHAAENFVFACINIYSATPDSRLSQMIRDRFRANGLNEKLNPTATDSVALSSENAFEVKDA